MNFSKFLVILILLVSGALSAQGCSKPSGRHFGAVTGPSGNNGSNTKLPPPAATIPFSVDMLDLNYDPAALIREVSNLNGGPLMVLRFQTTEAFELASLEIFANRPNLGMTAYAPNVYAYGTEVGSMYDIAPVGTLLAIVNPGETVSVTLTANLTNLADTTVTSEIYYITWRRVGDIDWTRTEVFGLHETILVEAVPEVTMLAVSPVTTNMVTKGPSTLVATLDLIETSGIDTCELVRSGLRIVGSGDTTTLWLVDENNAILAYAAPSYYSTTGYTNVLLNLPTGALRIAPGQTRRLRVMADTSTVTATSFTIEVEWFQALNLRNDQVWNWSGPFNASWATEQFTVNFN